jgi:TonB family protein
MGTRLLIGVLACVTCSFVLASKKVERPADNVIHVVSPRYPHKQQASKIGGSGVFRLTIDFKTGKVTNVAVVKSTGSDPLDREAIFALSQWRFKPGKLTTADIPITFQASGTVDLPIGLKLVPNG